MRCVDGARDLGANSRSARYPAAVACLTLRGGCWLLWLRVLLGCGRSLAAVVGAHQPDKHDAPCRGAVQSPRASAGAASRPGSCHSGRSTGGASLLSKPASTSDWFEWRSNPSES